MQTLPSVFPLLDLPCMTWTVHWTVILCRLPYRPLPCSLASACQPPALILCSVKVYDCDLSTLYLTPLIDLFLFTLWIIEIKLLMDHNVSDSPL